MNQSYSLLRKAGVLLVIVLFCFNVSYSNTRYVDSTNGNNTYNGTSWALAYKTLAYAVMQAHTQMSIDTILVAKGTYYPEYTSDGASADNSDKAFTFTRKGLVVLGGYPSGGGVRNRTLYPAVLSGNLGLPNDSTDNTYHVVLAVGTPVTPLDSTLMLDGFTITGGYGDNPSNLTVNTQSAYRRRGAGVCFIYASALISNCTISGNTSGDEGGGIGLFQSSPYIRYCTISHNQVNSGVSAGAGISIKSSSPVITHCTISENDAMNGQGGAIYNQQSSPVFVNCIVSGNKATIGAGFSHYSTGTATLVNCVISGNSASSRGGGFNFSDGALTLINSVVAGNYAWSSGGGIFMLNNNFSPTLKLNNVILWGNNSGIGSSGSLTSTVAYSIIQGGYTGTGNLNTDPLFVNAPLYSATSFTGGNFRLQAGSPAIHSGDTAGISQYLALADFGDLDSNHRSAGTSIDMGAYEYGSTPLPVVLVSFTAVASGKYVKLKWSTASEINNDRFVIERSADGQTFEDIASVKGQGTTVKSSSYLYVDESAVSFAPARGTNLLYYRLRQVDHNGIFSYSSTRTVSISNKLMFAQLQPNPCTNHATLEMDMVSAGSLDIVITNMQGSVISTKQAQVSAGINTVELDGVNALPDGIYFVTIKNDDTFHTFKLACRQAF